MVTRSPWTHLTGASENCLIVVLIILYLLIFELFEIEARCKCSIGKSCSPDAIAVFRTEIGRTVVPESFAEIPCVFPSVSLIFGPTDTLVSLALSSHK